MRMIREHGFEKAPRAEAGAPSLSGRGMPRRLIAVMRVWFTYKITGTVGPIESIFSRVVNGMIATRHNRDA
jgi:hypothetical protein